MDIIWSFVKAVNDDVHFGEQFYGILEGFEKLILGEVFLVYLASLEDGRYMTAGVIMKMSSLQYHLQSPGKVRAAQREAFHHRPKPNPSSERQTAAAA